MWTGQGRHDSIICSGGGGGDKGGGRGAGRKDFCSMQQNTWINYGRPHLPMVVMSPAPGAEAYNNQQTY